MTSETDGKPSLPRERLCKLTRVQRSRHKRFQENRLLARKQRYGEIDLIKAVALDHLTDVLGPSDARQVWGQVEFALELPGAYIEVVVRESDCSAVLVRSPDELKSALPRDEKVTVVCLHERIGEARERFRAFRARSQPGTPATEEPAITPLRLTDAS